MAGPFDPIISEPSNQTGDVGFDRAVDKSAATLITAAGTVVEGAAELHDDLTIQGVADDAYTIFNESPADGLSKEDQQLVNNVANRADSLRTAGSQGRIDAYSRTEALVRQEVARRPDLANKIRSAVQQRLGFNPQDQVTRQLNREMDLMYKSVERAAAAGVMIVDPATGRLNEREMMNAGMKLQQADEQLKNYDTRKSMSIDGQTSYLTQNAFQRLSPSLTGMFSMLKGEPVQMPDGSTRIPQAQEVQQILTNTKAKFIADFRQQAIRDGYRNEAIDNSIKQLDSQFNALQGYFSEDLQNRADYLRRLETEAQIDVIESLPALYALTKVLGDQGTGVLVGSVVQQTGITKQVGEELSAYVSKSIRGKTTLNNTARVLNGQESVTNLNGQERVDALNAVTAGFQSLKKRTGPFFNDEAPAFVHASREIAAAANQTGSLSDLENANGFLDASWRSSVVNRAHNQDYTQMSTQVFNMSGRTISRVGREVVRDVASTTGTLLDTALGGGELYRLSFNRDTLKFDAVLNRQVADRMSRNITNAQNVANRAMPAPLGGVLSAVGEVVRNDLEVPQMVQRRLAVLNNAVDNMKFAAQLNPEMLGGVHVSEYVMASMRTVPELGALLPSEEGESEE